MRFTAALSIAALRIGGAPGGNAEPSSGTAGRGAGSRLLTTITAVLLLAGSARAAPFAYITNSNGGDNSVSVIDLETNTVIAMVPVGEQPTEAAVNRAGTRAYVTNFGAGSVSVIDTGSNSVIATIAAGNRPFGVSVNLAGTRVYVANSLEGSVSVVDTATNTVIATVPVSGGSSTVTAIPDGSEVYVAGGPGGCYGSVVSVIDTATNTVTASVPMTDGACAVAATPDGTRVYVATLVGVSVIDTATHTAAAVATLPQAPVVGLAVNPAGTRIYTANFGNGTGRTVSVIDVATGAVTATVDVDDRPLAVSVDPTGARVFVVHNTNPGIVTVIDATSNTVTATVLVGNGPSMFGHEFIGPAPANLAPSCDAAEPSVNVLWPPDGHLTRIAIEGVTDPDDDEVSVAITSITQDEPLTKDWGRRKCRDGAGVGSSTARVRRERSAHGDGRVYHISFQATDVRGGECSGTVSVCVPRRPRIACVDQGPLFDSTGPCEPIRCNRSTIPCCGCGG